eukprot:jgi/Chlat1/7421/Chrsp6S07445
MRMGERGQAPASPSAAATCPVCGAEGSVQDVERHVAEHFDVGLHDDVHNDAAMARALQQQYDSEKGDTSNSSVAHPYGGASEPQASAPTAEVEGEKSSKPQGRGSAHSIQVDTMRRRRASQHGRHGGQGAHPLPGTEDEAEQFRGDMARLVSVQEPCTFFPVPEGFMNLLRWCLETEKQSSNHCRTFLSGDLQHSHSSNKEDAPSGNDTGWGCGWRNVQILSSHLLQRGPEYREALFGGCGFVPAIPALQSWLELAWARGFDEVGARQLDWAVRGRHKWIGSTECAALLRSFGIRVNIVDFKLTAPKSGSGDVNSAENSRNSIAHPHVQCDGCGTCPIVGPRFRSNIAQDFDLCGACMQSALEDGGDSRDYARMDRPAKEHMQGGGNQEHTALIQWVWDYFTSEVSAQVSGSQSSSVVSTNRPPIFFQHQGHSRTIVGIQKRRSKLSYDEEVFLLVLDPAQRTEEIVSKLKQRSGWQSMLKRGIHTLRKPEYQLCYVEEGIAHGDELQKMKKLEYGSKQYHS